MRVTNEVALKRAQEDFEEDWSASEKVTEESMKLMQSNWDKKVFVICDNQGTIGGLTKGRSSARGILGLLRQAAGALISTGMRVVLRWISSARNHADGPSRQQRLGYYAGPKK